MSKETNSRVKTISRAGACLKGNKIMLSIIDWLMSVLIISRSLDLCKRIVSKCFIFMVLTCLITYCCIVASLFQVEKSNVFEVSSIFMI